MKAMELICALRAELAKNKNEDLEVRILNDDHDSFDPVFAVETRRIMGVPSAEIEKCIVLNYN
jgi:hypothetical protein